MRFLRFAHIALTLSLAIVVASFVAIWAAGVVEVRRHTSDVLPEPNKDNPNGAAQARLVVVRGLQPNWDYRVFPGRNVIGRADQQPVDIDLQPQEPEDRIWSSRQHAAIVCDEGSITIEDLNSSNGTYVNRNIVRPGAKQVLRAGDIVQIGEVQLKIVEK